MKIPVIRVIIEDNSHLGGPMGSEYTTVIETKNFKTFDKARAWAEEQRKKHHCLVDHSTAPLQMGYVDLGSIGITIKNAVVEIEEAAS